MENAEQHKYFVRLKDRKIHTFDSKCVDFGSFSNNSVSFIDTEGDVLAVIPESQIWCVYRDDMTSFNYEENKSVW